MAELTEEHIVEALKKLEGGTALLSLIETMGAELVRLHEVTAAQSLQIKKLSAAVENHQRMFEAIARSREGTPPVN